MKSNACLSLTYVLAFCCSTAAGAQERGFWIVTATLKAESLAQIAGISANVERCGYPSFADFSAKFVGFASGFTAVVVGPFVDQRNAELARDRIQPCIPDAYVKYGAYLGQ